MNFEVTLSEAKTMIKALAAKESILLLSAPGVFDDKRNDCLCAGIEIKKINGAALEWNYARGWSHTG